MKTYWERIADSQFSSLSADEQESFADLRDRVSRRGH